MNQTLKVISLIAGVITLISTLLAIAYRIGCSDTEQKTLNKNVNIHQSDINELKGSMIRLEEKQMQLGQGIGRIEKMLEYRLSKAE